MNTLKIQKTSAISLCQRKIGIGIIKRYTDQMAPLPFTPLLTSAKNAGLKEGTIQGEII